MATRKRILAWDVAAKDVPRETWPSGRCKVSLGTSSKTEAKRRRAALDQLRAWAAWDVVRAIQDGRLALNNVTAAVKERGETALIELREKLAEEERGNIPTLRQEADRYLEWYERERAPKSFKQVRSRLDIVLRQSVEGKPLGDYRLDRATKADIEAALHAAGGADATIEALRLAVSGLFTWSIEDEAEKARVDGRVARWRANPAAGVQRRERRRRVTTASEQQVVRLLAAAEIYQAAYLRSLLHLGLREDELVHTRLHDDLDVSTWTWRIQPRPPDPRCPCLNCQSPRGWRPKSKRSHRTIEVPADPPQLREVITRYLAAYPVEEGDFVFRNPRTGRVWDAGRFDADLEALCRRADVRYGAKVAGGITAHVLRHTCATALVRAGVRESVIAALLGDTVQTVVNTYIHITAADVAKAIQRGPRYDG